MKFNQGDKVKVIGFYAKGFPYGGLIRDYTYRISKSKVHYYIDRLRHPFSLFSIMFGKVTSDREWLSEDEL